MGPFSLWGACGRTAKASCSGVGPRISIGPRGASAAQGSPQHPYIPCTWPGWPAPLLQVDLAGNSPGPDASFTPPAVRQAPAHKGKGKSLQAEASTSIRWALALCLSILGKL